MDHEITDPKDQKATKVHTIHTNYTLTNKSNL